MMRRRDKLLYLSFGCSLASPHMFFNPIIGVPDAIGHGFTGRQAEAKTD